MTDIIFSKNIWQNFDFITNYYDSHLESITQPLHIVETTYFDKPHFAYDTSPIQYKFTANPIIIEPKHIMVDNKTVNKYVNKCISDLTELNSLKEFYQMYNEFKLINYGKYKIYEMYLLSDDYVQYFEKKLEETKYLKNSTTYSDLKQGYNEVLKECNVLNLLSFYHKPASIYIKETKLGHSIYDLETINKYVYKINFDTSSLNNRLKICLLNGYGGYK